MNRRIDLGILYERAKATAQAAVSGSPDVSYGLTDVAPEDDWIAVGSSEFASTIPVHATLNGCVDALRDRSVTAADVQTVRTAPPQGTAVSVEDMRIARSWLADTLAYNIDEDGRQLMIDREVSNRDWESDPARVTSLVLALVAVAATATMP